MVEAFFLKSLKALLTLADCIFFEKVALREAMRETPVAFALGKVLMTFGAVVLSGA